MQSIGLTVRNVLNAWRPEAYHGWGKRPPFFEGWYFKVVDSAGRQPYAIIPGVFVGSQPGSTHAFVQTLDGSTGRSTYHRYPCDEFSAAPRELDVRIGPNRFRRDSMILDIDTQERTIQGRLDFQGGKGWPVTPTSPGIMGWYAYVPFMECYHGVLSFDHSITGCLNIDGKTLDYGRGRGYIEKDWGQSFPKAWIWMQSNHFATAGTCVTASVAVIPWLTGSFNGFIAGLWHDGRLYRFATYTGAKLERQEVTDRRVILKFVDPKKGGYRLEIEATRATAGLLRSPERTAMLQRVMESLTATIHVRLLENRTGRIVLDETGEHAGLEVVGDLPDLGVMQ